MAGRGARRRRAGGRRKGAAALLGICCASALSPTAATAQETVWQSAQEMPLRSALREPETAGPGSAWKPSLLPNSPPMGKSAELGQGEAFLSSLALPGLAQHRMGQRRWIAYAGLEALSAVLYLRSRRDAVRTRTTYREFAWVAARSGSSTGPRRDGDFEYYETLSQWPLSGAWDADPALSGLQPETDPTTYNGSIWALAMEIFGVDPAAPERSPGYARALEYYRERGYGPLFLWVWSGGPADRKRLGDLIRESDQGFRDARRALWTIAVNHLFSAVDGFVAVRLRSRPGTERIEVTASVRTP